MLIDVIAAGVAYHKEERNCTYPDPLASNPLNARTDRKSVV